MIPCSLLLRSVRCFQKRNISKKQSVTDILRQTVLFKRIIPNLLAFLIILFFILFISIFPLYFYRYERACVFSSSFFPIPVPMMLKRTFVFTLAQRGFLHPGGGGHLGIFWVGMCRPGLQIGTPFPLAPPMKSLWHPGYRAPGTLVKRQQKILSRAFYIFLSLASLRHREVSREEREPIDPTLASQADVLHCPTSRAGTHDEPLRTSAGQ